MTSRETAQISAERRERQIWSAAALLAVINLVFCLLALEKGFHIEGTEEAIDRANHGQHIALAAVPGLLTACVALGWRRRRALLAVVSAGCAVVAFILLKIG